MPTSYDPNDENVRVTPTWFHEKPRESVPVLCPRCGAPCEYYSRLGGPICLRCGPFNRLVSREVLRPAGLVLGVIFLLWVNAQDDPTARTIIHLFGGACFILIFVVWPFGIWRSRQPKAVREAAAVREAFLAGKVARTIAAAWARRQPVTDIPPAAHVPPQTFGTTPAKPRDPSLIDIGAQSHPIEALYGIFQTAEGGGESLLALRTDDGWLPMVGTDEDALKPSLPDVRDVCRAAGKTAIVKVFALVNQYPVGD